MERGKRFLRRASPLSDTPKSKKVKERLRLS
jgi:hypothetical protein